ncbi:MAG: sulfotransferase [Porphyrobacter sp.]|nr:sulfotransferase [Porphyrobacter sp.]
MTGSNLAASLALVDELQRALGRNDRARIVDAIRLLVEKRVPMGAQWQQIAYMAADHGELSLSRNAMALYVEASDGNPMARYQQAGLLAQGGELHAAYALLEALPENVPEPAVNAYSRGAAAVFIGKLEEARDLLERATKLRPQLGQAWLPLSTLVNFADEPELTEKLLAAESVMRQAPPAAQAPYYHALGKAYVDLGEHALAFEAFAQGAALKKAERHYDRQADRAAAEEAVRGYDAEAVTAIAEQQREPTNRTIFVSGLPRSGTTLVDQILTSHSAVVDGAEINRLPMLSREVGGAAFASLNRHVAARGTGPAGRLWLHWMNERFPARGRVVDKSMETSRYLGLAASLLPEAPIVWLKRDPLDCAWSCFRTHFLAGVEWSYDLEDIAFRFRLEDQLLHQWQQILGDRLLVVPYEALTDDPNGWTRRILGHCGLAEEPQAFAPHRNERIVTTSSVMQVRRPINRRAVGSAAPYRELLHRFVEAYGN